MEDAPTKIRDTITEEIKSRWPGKFRDKERFIFQEIRPGDRIFVGTGCGEPQYLVSSLLDYVKSKDHKRYAAIIERLGIRK